MEKTFYYRKHIGIMKKFLWVLAIPGIVLLVLGILSDIRELRVLFMIIGAIFILEPLAISKFYRRFTSTVLVINESGIHFINNKKDISMKYEEIESVKPASISNLGGFVTIVSKNGEKIKLTVVIENVGEFMLLLREKLDEKNLDVYNKDKLFGFYKTARYSDDSWRRIYHAFPEILIYSVLGIIVNILSINYFGEHTVNVTLLSIILFGIIYLIIELGYYGRKTRKSADPITWEIMSFDVVKEKRLIRYLVRIPSILILIGFIIEVIIG
jgi:hypothetical protein